MQLDRFEEYLENVAAKEIGYPVAFDFDYSALVPFLSYSLNNAGDPFMPMTYLLNSHEFEREVVSFYAQLARAPTGSVVGLRHQRQHREQSLWHVPGPRVAA